MEVGAGRSVRAAAALQRSGRGDETAFAEFYDLISPLVFGTVVRVVRDRALAEEVTQEVFVDLWRHAARFDPERGSPAAWAATIAHRRAVDRVRSVASARNRDAAEATITDRDHDAVADAATTSWEQGHVRDALGELTAGQREAVTLAYYGGHTYREVAALLDVPEGTIKTRIRDALIKLRDLMEVPS